MSERPIAPPSERKRRVGRALVLWIPILAALVLALISLQWGRGHEAPGDAASSAPPSGAVAASAETARGVGATSGPAAPPPHETTRSASDGASPPPDPASPPPPPSETTPGGAATGDGPSSPSSAAAGASAAPGEGTHGTLPREAIQSTVREAMPFLRFCFEWQLDLHPELGGRVSMEWRILPDRTVADANIVEDGLEDETVLRCFRGVIGRLTFPPPEGGEVTVRYPFVLSNAPEARPPDGI